MKYSVSVVIACHNPAGVIDDCLEALRRQRGDGAVEIIVADSSSDETPIRVQQRFPTARLMHFDQPLTIPQLRGLGVSESAGDLVALLDPYCIPAEGWLEALVSAHRVRPEAAIGGAVELERPERQGLLRWATYMAEYVQFMRPLPEGPATELPGSNTAYKRSALGNTAAAAQTGLWKTFLNEHLLVRGDGLCLSPAMVVRIRKPIPFGDFLRSRYHHGRAYAAMRVRGNNGRMQRYLRACITGAIPLLFLWRQGRAVLDKRRYRRRFLAVAPLLFLFHCSWALGELLGYLAGPGRSEAKLLY